MRTDAQTQEIADYRHNGFVAIPNLLTAEETAELKTAVERSARMEEDQEAAATGYNAIFHQRVNLWRNDAVIKKFLVDGTIGRIAGQLSGMSKVRLWHDHSLAKAPWAAPTTWHLDTPYWSFHDPRPLSVWIALQDTTVLNGCMHFLPGSNRLARYDNVSLGHGRMNALFDVYPEMGKIDPVPVPLKAGSATFHNGLTAHGAGGNMTRGWRKAMVAIYFPDEVVYSGQPNAGLSPARMETIQPGDRVADDDFNPLVYDQSLG